MNWTAPTGSAAKDWVGLFKTGDSNNNFGKWVYTGGATSGSFTTTAPSTGIYEFRVLLNDGFTDVARSNTITVVGPTPPATSTPPSTSAPSLPSPAPVSTPTAGSGSGQTYYVSSGVKCLYDDAPINLKCGSFGPSGVAAGNDSNPGTFSQPFKTIQKCFDVVGHGGSLGADKRCIIREGAYDTVNGWRGPVQTSNDSLIPSGSSWVHPFTVVAYSPTVAAGGNCTPSVMPKPGDVYGDTNGCEHVVVYMSMSCELASNCTYTVRQMQNTDPGCTDSAGNHADCVGAPTLRDCQDLYGPNGYPPGYTSFYDGGCWTGSGVGSGTVARGWWVYHDRTAQASSGAVINPAGVNTSSVLVRYVVFDGINVDGRGVVTNLITDSWMTPAPDYALIMKSYKFMNARWQNSGASMVADSGIDRDSQFSNGQFQDADRYFVNVRFTHAGIPFNTYLLPGNGLNARENPAMKFLHAFYAHVGGNHCDYCESDFNAGQGFATDLANNSLTHSYIHDNEIGVQTGGEGNMDFSNNLVINNFDQGFQTGSHSNTVTIRNNTIIGGPKAQLSQGGGSGIQERGGAADIIATNNIIVGFGVGIDNYQCGILPDNTCLYTDHPLQARNNLIKTNTAGNELRNSGSPVVNMITSGNILNQDPGFINPTGLDYRLQSSSPAIDKGYPNGLTTDFAGKPRPWGATIDIGAYEYGN